MQQYWGVGQLHEIYYTEWGEEMSHDAYSHFVGLFHSYEDAHAYIDRSGVEGLSSFAIYLDDPAVLEIITAPSVGYLVTWPFTNQEERSKIYAERVTDKHIFHPHYYEDGIVPAVGVVAKKKEQYPGRVRVGFWNVEFQTIVNEENKDRAQSYGRNLMLAAYNLEKERIISAEIERLRGRL